MAIAREICLRWRKVAEYYMAIYNALSPKASSAYYQPMDSRILFLGFFAAPATRDARAVGTAPSADESESSLESSSAVWKIEGVFGCDADTDVRGLPIALRPMRRSSEERLDRVGMWLEKMPVALGGRGWEWCDRGV